MATYDLYGFLSDDVNEAKKILEAVLEIKFDDREGDYQGGQYFQWGPTSGEHFLLKKNIDPIDDEPAEMAFSSYKTLLYINDTAHSEKLQDLISQRASDFILLRHEELD